MRMSSYLGGAGGRGSLPYDTGFIGKPLLGKSISSGLQLTNSVPITKITSTSYSIMCRLTVGSKLSRV